MSKKLVFFDLDGTILKGISSENRFILFLLKKRYIRLPQIIAATVFVFRWAYRYKIDVFIKNKAYLKGLTVESIYALVDDFVEKEILKTIRPSILARLQEHQKAQDTVVLLTGTHDFLGNAIAKHLAIEHVEASHCVIENGCFTQQPPTQHPFYDGKVTIAEKWREKYRMDWKDCVAYGNSINDALLLDIVGKPVAVYPDHRLYRLAKKKGWEIINR